MGFLFVKLILIGINVQHISGQATVSYKHRGFMLDCARKFFPVPTILAILDRMSDVHMNVFHWSFTNNEGFNVQWDYDDGLLTNLSALGGEFYTHDDIRQVVAYAQARGIEVIPEFDFPGHVGAWRAAYPEMILEGTVDEFDVSQEDVFPRLTALFDELWPLFNTQRVHVGHDECSNEASELQKSLAFAEQQAHNHGKTPIIWNDPITSRSIDVSQTSYIVQAWTNMDALNAAINTGQDVIASVSQYWYIGGGSSPDQFVFPSDSNVIGGELAWFTSPGDPTDPLEMEWVFNWIDIAGNKLCTNFSACSYTSWTDEEEEEAAPSLSDPGSEDENEDVSSGHRKDMFFLAVLTGFVAFCMLVFQV